MSHHRMWPPAPIWIFGACFLKAVSMLVGGGGTGGGGRDDDDGRTDRWTDTLGPICAHPLPLCSWPPALQTQPKRLRQTAAMKYSPKTESLSLSPEAGKIHCFFCETRNYWDKETNVNWIIFEYEKTISSGPGSLFNNCSFKQILVLYILTWTLLSLWGSVLKQRVILIH